MAAVLVFNQRVLHKSQPTKRALDAGDSAAFSSIFLASSFSCSQNESTPAPAPVTQTVGRSPDGEAEVHLVQIY